MAEIRISDDILGNMIDYMLNYNSSSSSNSSERIIIYQGTIPTDISDTTAITDRTSDILIEHTGFSVSSNIISTSYTTASASGVATWFSIYKSTFGYAVGTVGLTNSFDLVVGNTTISAGLQYRTTGLSFDLPSTITYLHMLYAFTGIITPTTDTTIQISLIGDNNTIPVSINTSNYISLIGDNNTIPVSINTSNYISLIGDNNTIPVGISTENFISLIGGNNTIPVSIDTSDYISLIGKNNTIPISVDTSDYISLIGKNNTIPVSIDT